MVTNILLNYYVTVPDNFPSGLKCLSQYFQDIVQTIYEIVMTQQENVPFKTKYHDKQLNVYHSFEKTLYP